MPYWQYLLFCVCGLFSAGVATAIVPNHPFLWFMVWILLIGICGATLDWLMRQALRDRENRIKRKVAKAFSKAKMDFKN
jgi:hypothetical protein